ncbi:MAG: cyclic nucleotide-binding domain-containing protein [Chloroflexi bacterium]|nr:cyclic nucleotide-binding domain-containing protein [Chloroflexota bacterium]
MNVNKETLFKMLKSSFYFQEVPENFLTWLVDRSQLLQFQAEQIIYEQEAVPEKLYLIVSGSVSLYIEDNNTQYLVNGLHVEDIFGVEVMTQSSVRITSARAEKRAVVLAIPLRILQKITQEFPAFSIQFDLQLHSLQFLIKKPMNWLQTDEVVYYISREHPIILVFRILKPFLVSIAFLILAAILFYSNTITTGAALWMGAITGVMGLVCGAWNAFDWMNDYYVVTNHRLVFMEKIAMLYDSRKETPFSAILSITKQSTLNGRLYKFGDVVMRTFTGLIKFHNVEYADAVADIIEKQWVLRQEKISAQDDEDPEVLLRQQIAGKNALKNQTSEEKSHDQLIALGTDYASDLFSRLLRLRQVIGNTIYYRTHWFVFIRKTLLPFIGLATCIVFLLAPQNGWLGLVPETSGTYQVILVGLGAVMMAWWIYSTWDWRNDYFMITPEQIVDVYRKPLGVDERRAAPIRNIQTIEFKKKGIFGLLFNFGTVFIRVGDVDFTFDYVPDPSYVQQEIFNQFRRLKDKEKKDSMQLNGERLAHWMDAYHKVINTQSSEDQEDNTVQN